MTSVLTLEDFVETLFRTETGFVYAPYIQDGRFIQRFFKWPDNKDQIISQLTTDVPDREVYLSPLLFSRASIHPDNFKGTFYLWTEFDGKTPSNYEHPPSIKIQSSNPGHEHWYWQLTDFETDADTIISTTKKLAYALEADLSVWDYAVLLRPPDTFNYKRGKEVKVIEYNSTSYYLDQFNNLPIPPDSSDIIINKTKLPSLHRLIATYQWTEDAYDIFTKQLEKGHRSEAMARLVFELSEMGMSNDEIYVLLKDVDDRCGKFSGRTDTERRLTGLISYVRSKKAIQLDIVDQSPVYRFSDFMNTEINLKWVIPGLVPVAGSVVVYGPSTAGKSTWALRLAIAMASGAEDFIGWKIERKQKVLFLSLEMPHDELKYFFQNMKLDEGTITALQENFFVWPLGHPYPLDTRDQQTEVLKYIDQYDIDQIFIDSLGVSTYGSILNPDDMKRLYSFMNEDVRKARGCGYLFIHHPHKNAQAGNFADAYGDTYIVNNAQTVIYLKNPVPGKLEVEVQKSRLSKDQASFWLRKTEDRNFEKIEKPVTTKKDKSEEDFRSSNLLSFGRPSASS